MVAKGTMLSGNPSLWSTAVHAWLCLDTSCVNLSESLSRFWDAAEPIIRSGLIEEVRVLVPTACQESDSFSKTSSSIPLFPLHAATPHSPSNCPPESPTSTLHTLSLFHSLMAPGPQDADRMQNSNAGSSTKRALSSPRSSVLKQPGPSDQDQASSSHDQATPAAGAPDTFGGACC